MSRKQKNRKRGGASIPCPRCEKPSHVVITRRVGTAVRRQRECNSRARHRFDTLEVVQ